MSMGEERTGEGAPLSARGADDEHTEPSEIFEDAARRSLHTLHRGVRRPRGVSRFERSASTPHASRGSPPAEALAGPNVPPHATAPGALRPRTYIPEGVRTKHGCEATGRCDVGRRTPQREREGQVRQRGAARDAHYMGGPDRGPRWKDEPRRTSCGSSCGLLRDGVLEHPREGRT